MVNIHIFRQLKLYLRDTCNDTNKDIIKLIGITSGVSLFGIFHNLKPLMVEYKHPAHYMVPNF